MARDDSQCQNQDERNKKKSNDGRGFFINIRVTSGLLFEPETKPAASHSGASFS